jgi:hypothetical protein
MPAVPVSPPSRYVSVTTSESVRPVEQTVTSQMTGFSLVSADVSACGHHRVLLIGCAGHICERWMGYRRGWESMHVDAYSYRPHGPIRCDCDVNEGPLAFIPIPWGVYPAVLRRPSFTISTAGIGQHSHDLMTAVTRTRSMDAHSG